MVSGMLGLPSAVALLVNSTVLTFPTSSTLLFHLPTVVSLRIHRVTAPQVWCVPCFIESGKMQCRQSLSLRVAIELMNERSER